VAVPGDVAASSGNRLVSAMAGGRTRPPGSPYRGPVPLFGPDDQLPFRPRRVIVAGTSGAGKTTLARRVAQVLAVPHVEIDALFHGPGWTRLETFAADVERFSATSGWVTEWQYSLVRGVLAERADLLVWLDLPRAVVMWQVIGRTLRRRLRREVLWNGNVEPPLRTFFGNRGHIVRWAWSTHHRSALRVASLRAQRPDLVVVRLRNRAAVARWLAGALLRWRPAPVAERNTADVLASRVQPAPEPVPQASSTAPTDRSPADDHRGNASASAIEHRGLRVRDR
jgi:adenylate kinase family enzyme